MTDAIKDASDGAKQEETRPAIGETEATPEKLPVAPTEPEPAVEELKPDQVADKVETTPSQTKSVEDEAVKTTPVETEPVKPVEVKPTEDAPVETQQTESTPSEAVHKEVPPVEVKTTETKTVAIKDGESVTTETKSIEIRPVGVKSTEETSPAEAAPDESKPVESEPAEAETAKTEPIEEKSKNVEITKEVEPEPSEAKPTKEEAVKEEAVKEEPVHEDIVKEEPMKEEPVTEEPIKEEAVKEEAVKEEPLEEEPIKTEPVEPKPVEMAEEFSDPDEDDLDDLDDMLDDFSTVNLDSQKSPVAPSAHKSEAPKAAPSGKLPELDEFSEEEFAKQLQAGMADLLGEMEKSPDMQAQFEDMFKQIAASEGISDPAAPSTSAKPAPPPSAEDASFQETIRRTMERLQGSGEQATAAAASGGADDFMSEMLKQLGSGDLGALGGEENEEDFSKILMGMMEQLTNKEILYEPMKELDQKFPGWLAKNRSTTPKEDLKRYEEQRTVVREIVAKFEERTYSDSNAADREFIVDRMQKMQAAGSPPADLVGDMPSAQEALNPTDESCNPQ